MCLILTAYKAHPDYPLIIIANRDEFYARPTEQAHWWAEHPEMLAGKDSKGNGSWFGISKKNKFAALTNYRDGMNLKTDAPTRGKLVTNFLVNEVDSATYLAEIAKTGDLYNGYNLLTFDNGELWYYSNISKAITPVSAGVHGLSNALLNTSWPKVERGKAGLKTLLEDEVFSIEGAFELLRNAEKPSDAELPSTGVPLEWERLLSSMCIEAEGYGTRCSTVLLWHKSGKVYFEERSYVPALGKRAFTLG